MRRLVMRDAAFRAYRWLAALFFAGVVAEFFLAGLGVFRTQDVATTPGTTLTRASFDHSFGPHIVLGDVLALISLALFVVVLVARPGRRVLLTTLAVLVLIAVQATLADAGPPAVRALHPVLGLLVLGAVGYALYFSGVPWHRSTGDFRAGRTDDRA
jgi:hypothetical protein